ncbi:phosphopyruvate hydratase [Desulfurococcus mucosus]|uniref:Enolase n=1 Tax=Desulfurococcus mucosus (strain ATCC 35584 / DSM 2162 / JCM 9187 / O7/1) TaxID=765177 RepID=E8RA16_DESM0|nr:phosphopyruvate hydratase [Desulfurococcus mucosus]ADV65342.1 enolase [Desulfurococcus mucosus DSM 2162]
MYLDIYDDAYIIKDVKARTVLDSRGNPTVQVRVVTEGLGVGVANAPSGASTGRHEAVELRDGGRDFKGKGVSRAVENVNKLIAPALVGLSSRRQYEVDSKLIEIDGTPNKARLGGNAIVATSLAVAKAASSTMGVPFYYYLGGRAADTLPVPLLNIINGGVHAGNKLDFQEFMIVPAGFSSFHDALKAAVEVYHELKTIIKNKYGPTAVNVGDEGGYAPPLEKVRDALDLLVEAIKGAGYEPGGQIAIAIDAASSQFYREDKGAYIVEGREMTRDDMLLLYEKLVEDYPVVSIEDPLHEEDFEGFAEMRRRLGGRILIVGDDLFTTNPARLSKGIETGAGNAVLVKVNQVGTLSETIDVVKMAHENGYRAIISHRSGETEDTSIADIVVGLSTGLIKTGAPARGERTAKYNRLLEIAEELEKPRYPGFKVFPRKP